MFVSNILETCCRSLVTITNQISMQKQKYPNSDPQDSAFHVSLSSYSIVKDPTQIPNKQNLRRKSKFKHQKQLPEC